MGLPSRISAVEVIAIGYDKVTTTWESTNLPAEVARS
jgi:hypothetical protein